MGKGNYNKGRGVLKSFSIRIPGCPVIKKFVLDNNLEFVTDYEILRLSSRGVHPKPKSWSEQYICTLQNTDFENIWYRIDAYESNTEESCTEISNFNDSELK